MAEEDPEALLGLHEKERRTQQAGRFALIFNILQFPVRKMSNNDARLH